MRFLVFVVVCSLSFSMVTQACGPSPQKVVKQVTVNAMPKDVWAVVSNVGGMQDWHPDIQRSEVRKELDKEGNETVYRTLTLASGGKLIERVRPMQPGIMKFGVVIEQGSLAVSNYSDAMTVKPALTAGKSIVTWTGRFNNKANLLVPPKGQDNEAAIAAVTDFYLSGLNHLKQMFANQSSI